MECRHIPRHRFTQIDCIRILICSKVNTLKSLNNYSFSDTNEDSALTGPMSCMCCKRFKRTTFLHKSGEDTSPSFLIARNFLYDPLLLKILRNISSIKSGVL